MAFDLDDTRSSNGTSGFSLKSKESYSSSSLKSDLEPYVGDLPLVDSLYKVGPGDLFQIFFESSSMDKQVNSEGNIILNRIGVVHLEGLTLKDAKKLILDNLKTSFKGSDCFVNLSKPKIMRIFVTGAVNTPGVYDVFGNFRLSDALREVNGFSIFAQRGDVRIISADGSIQVVNIRKFMLEGDLRSNPYLTQGCTIQVPFLDYEKSWVTVIRDSTSYIIQLEPGENILDEVVKTYSFYPPQPFSAVLVKEKNGVDTLISPPEAAIYQPRAYATIEILSPKLGVYVAGAVANPGPQVYRSDRKIIQYVSGAGLLTSTKIEDRMEVFRKTGQQELVSTNDVLRPGDIIYVKQNAEQKFLTYAPIVLSLVSFIIALLTLRK